MGRHEQLLAPQPHPLDPRRYYKLIWTLAGTAASAVSTWTLTGGKPTIVEAINLLIVLIGAFQVWYVTETDNNPKGKAVMAGLTGALVLLQSDLGTHGAIGIPEWVQIGVAGLTAAGVFATPNKS